MTNFRIVPSMLLAALLAGLVAPRLADATATACLKTLVKNTQKFLALKSKALQTCEDKKRSGTMPPSTVCRTDSGTALAISHASSKARTAMVKGCCGDDRVCGNGDDVSLQVLDWTDPTCPNFENGATGSCDNAIDDPGDVADCLL